MVENDQIEILPNTDEMETERPVRERHRQQRVLSIPCMVGFLLSVLCAIACVIPAIPAIDQMLSNMNLLVWESIVMIVAFVALLLSIIGVCTSRKPRYVGRGFGANGIVFSSTTLVVCIALVIFVEYLIHTPVNG